MSPPPGTRAGTRGTYSKTDRRRQEIVRAAAELFADRGYHASSTRDIAQKAGISEAGLRHHFPTKTDLLQGVLLDREEQDYAQTLPARSGLDTLRRYLQIVERNTHERHVVELYTVLSAEATSEDHPAHDYFARRYTWVVEILTKAAVDLAGAGRLRPGVAPGSFARTLTAVVDGLQLQWLLDPTVDMLAETTAFIDAHLTEPL